MISQVQIFKKKKGGEMIERKGVKERNGEKSGEVAIERNKERLQRDRRIEEKERDLLCRAGFLRSQH